MRARVILATSVLAFAGLIVAAAAAAATEVAYLRQDCSGITSDCFTDMASLESWIWNVREPDEQEPLLVDIGPGEFGPLACPSATQGSRNGWVTFRGAGRQQTRIFRPGGHLGSNAAVKIVNCEALHFQDLTIEGGGYAVSWHEGGSSTWTNVHLVSGGSGNSIGFGWYDNDQNPCEDRAIHYFFSSKIETRGGSLANVAYRSTCSEAWFYGGEVQATWDGDSSTSTAHAAALIQSGGDLRIFGSAVRSSSGQNVSAAFQNGLFGIDVTDGGVFHMHGGIINANTLGALAGASPIGLSVEAGGFAHTPGTAFVLDAATGGTPTRVEGDALSPFLWQSGPTPPMAATESNVIHSEKGKDIFVETDCQSDGSCVGGDQPHLMIYSEDCATDGPWFNVVTRACRGVIAP